MKRYWKMTEPNYLFAKTPKGYKPLYYGTCQTIVKRVDEYYFHLNRRVKISTLNTFISGIQEEICKNISIVKDINFDLPGGLYPKLSSAKAVKVNTKGLSPGNKLFINQIVRYLGTEDCLETVKTYCELKKQYPSISFWKLFHAAHIITPQVTYRSYHQPFNSCYCAAEYDINVIKNSLKIEFFSILDSTSSINSIKENKIDSLQRLYSNKNWVELKKELKSLFNSKIERFKCVDNKNAYYLSIGKAYEGTIKNNLIKVLNDDFQNKYYKIIRFKKL